MVDEIFEMIMKEARSRKGETLELQMLLVMLEVQEKVCDAIKTLKVDRIKSTRLTFRRTDNVKER